MDKWWRIYQDEAGDGTTGPGGGGGAGGDPAAGADQTPPAKPDAGGPAGDAAAAPAAGGEKKPADMAAAIDAALGYEPGKDGKASAVAAAAKGAPAGETAEAKLEREKKETEDKAVKERDAKAAAGDQVAIKEKAAADAKAAVEAKKPVDLKTLELTKEQRALLKTETAQRYDKVLGIAKTERARAETAEAKLKPAVEAREAILSVLKETNTSDADLGNLLEYNRMCKSGRPEDLTAALAMVDAQRTDLLRLLGRKGDSYDPLADPANADLKQDVEDQKITPERALEQAASRRREALVKAGEKRGEQQRQSQDQINKAHEKGLADVEAWSAQVARADIDFKAKESILLPKIDQIVATYPPHLWLPTIKQAYELIVVQKAPAALPAGGDKPLRPSGAKPGGPAPTSMGEAIDQGLGYAKT